MTYRKQEVKWQNFFLPAITLNMNELNSPIDMQKVEEWI